MGWICSCFAVGKKERSRPALADFQRRSRSTDRSTDPILPFNSHSLGAQLRSSTTEDSAYEEVFQPKQAVSGSLHGLRLFDRNAMKRAKSLGSGNAFERGEKLHIDKKTEARYGEKLHSDKKRTAESVDRLQEEVENLKRRLAEEEEAARKLRHEVSYLRSCGVLQSPDRYRSCNFEKESVLSRDGEAQRNLHSWMGLSLSPASRFQLEEQLRSMAAEELAKVPGKGLANGQKALIVAANLWQYKGDPQQEQQIRAESVNSYATAGAASLPNQLLSEYTASNHFQKETLDSDSAVPSIVQDPIFRGHPDVSISSKSIGINATSSPSLLRRVDLSSDHQNENFESPRFSSHPLAGLGCQMVDQSDGQRFIDLGYQELEKKHLKRPSRVTSTPEGSPPRKTESLQWGAFKAIEQDVFRGPLDVNCAPACPESVAVIESSKGSSGNCNSTPKSYVAFKSGRVWQPLSPVWEANSGQSSAEDLETTGKSQVCVSDSADCTSASLQKSPPRISSAGNDQEEFNNLTREIGEVPDDDLFILSPRKLHHSYNPWDDAHRVDDEAISGSNVDLSPLKCWSISGETDFNDLVPIQCQSPTFSPKQKSSRKTFNRGRDFKMEDYPRDKFFKDMGLKVDGCLFQSVSCTSIGVPVAEKENCERAEILPVINVRQLTLREPRKEVSPARRKSGVLRDVAV